MRNGFLISLTVYCLLCVGCCKSEQRSAVSEKQSSDYRDKVNVELQLGPASGVEDMKTDDMFFTVENNGHKTINQLMVAVALTYPDGQQGLHRDWCLVDQDKWMQKASTEEDSDMWKPLEPGETLQVGWPMHLFFIGRMKMRKKAKKTGLCSRLKYG